MILTTLKKSKGFTLIELLIVIVIIGILAGIAISVIDPKKQQDRAHDASIKATLGKAALSTEGYVSAYGQAPTPEQFIAGLKNTTTETCSSPTDPLSCDFGIEGNALPSTCSNDGWSGTGGTQCTFHYERQDPAAVGADATQFVLYAKSFGLTESIFKYDNTRGVILVCPSESVADPDTCVE